MISLFAHYFDYLRHPFLKRKREDQLGEVETLMCSWGMHFFSSFYGIFAIYLGLLTYEHLQDETKISAFLLKDFNLSLQKVSIFILITEAVLYPFIFHFTYRFWQSLLKFYGQLFNIAEDIEEDSNELIKSLYAANIFLVFPIFGKLMSFMAQFFILFKGLTVKVHFSKTQATAVLLTPFFLLFLVAILIVSYFIFLLSLIWFYFDTDRKSEEIGLKF